MIELLKTDITKIVVDAIVNAANSSLLGGGGVDGAIHRAGGPEILEECIQIRERYGRCATGEAVITTAGNLPAEFVIHTVGPVWEDGNKNEETQLANCYNNSLKLAEEYKLRSIAFPNISTGVYGYPKEKAAPVAVNAVKSYFLKNTNSKIKKLFFLCFDEENFLIYNKILMSNLKGFQNL